MALELETTIMEEIGLGNHFNWFNGSGSCPYIRKNAARRLPEAIQNHHVAGDLIAEPDQRLCNVVRQIAQEGDESEYSLTRTWKAASDVIAIHIHQAEATPEKRNVEYAWVLKHLQENYLPRKVRQGNFSIPPQLKSLK